MVSDRAWDPEAYDHAWTAMAESGKDAHGEVAFVERLLVRHGLPRDGRLLDAGCGTGRVAIELSRRGYLVHGTDVDPDMLGHAAAKMPELPWHLGSLAEVALPHTFHAVVMAGNVILFVDERDRAAVIANVAAHLQPGGLLVAGFQLARADGRRVPLARWDGWAEAHGLELVERHATWDEDPWTPDSDYAVSVHRR
jgi:2-polyprenyl-3-methyl-5-hydroxy-6-metoxy-1,4-benzoquinol methylase